jgi:hypothetical protein
MECLIKYLVSGKIYKYPKKQAISLIVVKFSDIINIIIPFFEKNPLLGTKSLEYLDWCKVSKLMKDGSHLTIKGFNKIKDIKSRRTGIQVHQKKYIIFFLHDKFDSHAHSKIFFLLVCFYGWDVSFNLWG